MRDIPRSVAVLTIVVAFTAICAAQKVRYFKAEHGVGATYVKLGSGGRYKVIDREHVGVFLTDEGRWQQKGAVITFGPTDQKKNLISGHRE